MRTLNNTLSLRVVWAWNMARKLKIMENEKHSLDDLKNNEINEKLEK